MFTVHVCRNVRVCVFWCLFLFLFFILCFLFVFCRRSFCAFAKYFSQSHAKSGVSVSISFFTHFALWHRFFFSCRWWAAVGFFSLFSTVSTTGISNLSIDKNNGKHRNKLSLFRLAEEKKTITIAYSVSNEKCNFSRSRIPSSISMKFSTHFDSNLLIVRMHSYIKETFSINYVCNHQNGLTLNNKNATKLSRFVWFIESSVLLWFFISLLIFIFGWYIFPACYLVDLSN